MARTRKSIISSPLPSRAWVARKLQLRNQRELVSLSELARAIRMGKNVSEFRSLRDVVAAELKKEGSLQLAFRKRKTKARIGCNPATGREIKIPARTRLRFTPAKSLKDAAPGTK